MKTWRTVMILAIGFVVPGVPAFAQAGSCVDRCGENRINNPATCYCDVDCVGDGILNAPDCCQDFCSACPEECGSGVGEIVATCVRNVQISPDLGLIVCVDDVYDLACNQAGTTDECQTVLRAVGEALNELP